MHRASYCEVNQINKHKHRFVVVNNTFEIVAIRSVCERKTPSEQAVTNLPTVWCAIVSHSQLSLHINNTSHMSIADRECFFAHMGHLETVSKENYQRLAAVREMEVMGHMVRHARHLHSGNYKVA